MLGSKLQGTTPFERGVRVCDLSDPHQQLVITSAFRTTPDALDRRQKRFQECYGRVQVWVAMTHGT